MTHPVFGVLVDAYSDAGNEYPEGELHHLLVLVPAYNPDAATSEAMLALADKRWSKGQVKQIERFGVPLASVTDRVLREAAEKALAGHRAIVVYGRA